MNIEIEVLLSKLRKWLEPYFLENIGCVKSIFICISYMWQSILWYYNSFWDRYISFHQMTYSGPRYWQKSFIFRNILPIYKRKTTQKDKGKKFYTNQNYKHIRPNHFVCILLYINWRWWWCGPIYLFICMQYFISWDKNIKDCIVFTIIVFNSSQIVYDVLSLSLSLSLSDSQTLSLHHLHLYRLM